MATIKLRTTDHIVNFEFDDHPPIEVDVVRLNNLIADAQAAERSKESPTTDAENEAIAKVLREAGFPNVTHGLVLAVQTELNSFMDSKKKLAQGADGSVPPS
jgi:hypothetical protein